MSYFGNIKRGIKTTATGMRLTLKHLFEARRSRAESQIQDPDFFQKNTGHVTIQYPHQTINVPDNGRYQLDCEIDDCIVCDKCAKICPVDCIDIEAIKSPELIRLTSDGSPVRLHAAKFDIDLAKCCFCGLCTTVCPTECLTMNSEYDYAVQDVNLLNYAFSNLSPEQAQEKRELYEQFVAEKEAAKAASKSPVQEQPSTGFRPGIKPKTTGEETSSATPKPVFRPTPKPGSEESKDKAEEKPNTTAHERPKPVFKPAIKPQNTATVVGEKDVINSEGGVEGQAEKEAVQNDVAKPVFKPAMKPSVSASMSSDPTKNERPKPVFRPGIKPQSTLATGGDEKKDPEIETVDNAKESGESKIAAKPVFRPGMKTAGAQSPAKELTDKTSEGRPKPVFKPNLKPAIKKEEDIKADATSQPEETKSEKVVFRPALKPKTEDTNDAPKPFKPSLKPKK